MNKIFFVMSLVILCATQANAGGFLGDIANVIAPGDVGTQLDQANDQLKQAVPAYGAAERTLTQCFYDAAGNAVQQVLDHQGSVIQTIPCNSAVSQVYGVPGNSNYGEAIAPGSINNSCIAKGLSDICTTAYGICSTGSCGEIGLQCYCNTNGSIATGFVR